MFGHGTAFKTVKWPPTWYGAYAVLDTLGRYPALWRGRHADPADRTALAELAACPVRYNMSRDGTVTPRSAFQGFAWSSFGQKKRPSGFATARVLAVLHRLDDLAGDAAAVDVTAFSSSKGDTGRASTGRIPVIRVPLEVVAAFVRRRTCAANRRRIIEQVGRAQLPFLPPPRYDGGPRHDL